MRCDELLVLPYPDRRLIIFQTTADIQKMMNERREREDAKSRYQAREKRRWTDLRYNLSLLNPRVLVKENVAYWSDVVMMAKGVFSKELPGIVVDAIDSHAFLLPHGHPLANIVYCGHPANPRSYAPLAQFHRLMFENKVLELQSILRHLGAATIQIDHVAGWQHTEGAQVGGNIGKKTADVKGSRTDGNQHALHYQQTLDVKREPSLPPDSELHWYWQEPTWQDIARSRLEFGLQGFELNLEYTDDYGINMQLKASVEKAGLNIGGKFESHTSTVWKVTGTFAAT